MNIISRILSRFGYYKESDLLNIINNLEYELQLLRDQYRGSVRKIGEYEKELMSIYENRLLTYCNIKDLSIESVIILHEGYLNNLRFLEKRLHEIVKEGEVGQMTLDEIK